MHRSTRRKPQLPSPICHGSDTIHPWKPIRVSRGADERLFADYWIGLIGVQRERCLAEERARRAPKYVYDYNARGGWVAVDMVGRRKPTPVWTNDAVRGGRR